MTDAGEHDSPLRVAIIGAGPSGLYAAEALTKQKETAVYVDVFDRLPTPYGLVRYGVAPDHQKIKSVTTALQRILEHPHVRFLGHVEFGRDLTRDDLMCCYDAVVYAVGAASDRSLGIPGENLPGSRSATEFVAWYNGHPDSDVAAWTLSSTGVAVVGVGNVAIDVTRVLAKTVDELRDTDIADHALDALAHSAVSDIYILGRRGPAQAKFTTKELKELGALADADVIVKPEEIALTPEQEGAISDPIVRRNVEVLRGFAARSSTGKARRIHLRFLVSPVEIVGESEVEGVRLERNRLDEKGQAVGTGVFETLPVQLVLRSVGYKGRPLQGVPFDTGTGTIPNEDGRVIRDGEVAPGEYTTGWIKRGPSGIIGTNKACAFETMAHLLGDLALLPRTIPQGDITTVLDERKVDYVVLADWLELDRHEQEQGKASGRVRVKVVSRTLMLQLARAREQAAEAEVMA